VSNRVDGRVVKQALVGENIECPGRRRHDAEGRCPITKDGRAGHLGKSVDAAPEIVAKRCGRMAMNASMVPAVAGDFVAGSVNPAHKRRSVFRNLSHDEEGRADTKAIELIEQPTRDRLQPAAVVSNLIRVNCE
jgi:hypothetical protein